ncbi:MAG: hypothetical protein A4E52_02150 [Pelotomaculum sp. PtaB.Bin013]|nr:MAG: hypothetical protein A4E52_02150 [Pelotomaculum sp. PtaB.Bin013]
MSSVEKVIDINCYRSKKVLHNLERHFSYYEFFGFLSWAFLIFVMAEIYLRRIGW